MNSKQTRVGHQNDTSIIENLPQRLKKKFADKAAGLENHTCDDDIDDEINNAGNETTVQGDAPSVDFFLKYSNANPQNYSNVNVNSIAKRNLEEIERSIPGVLHLNNTKSENRFCKKQSEEILRNDGIPGIIRLNATERLRLVQHADKANGRTHPLESVHHNKILRPKNTQREKEFNKDLPPVSPARTFISSKYPTWFDEPQLEVLSDDLKGLYNTLTGLMQQSDAILQHWTYFNDTRKHLLAIFKQIVLQHLKLCCEMKCDSLFWKLLFYNVREYLKYSNLKNAQNCLSELIQDGIIFYKELYTCLKFKYLKAENKPQISSNPSTSIQKSEKFELVAKVVVQKLLINLGDLCRYNSLQLKSNDFSDAASYYREAQCLMPANGIPYNQLAIVAIHDRKKFEAIYLHMRSLMSTNSIQSAKESLLTLFDEIRKKFEKTEPKISPVHQYKQTNNNAGSCNNKVVSPLRKEVWIHPDGVRRLHRTNVEGRRSRLSKPAKNVEIRLDEMSDEDLLHRFISIYLYMIGKLYTGIGMETLPAHQNKLLTQLSALLKKDVTPLLLTRSKMLKICALNIFILHHNVQQARREVRYYTFTFCNQIFGVLLQKCNQIFSIFLEDGTNNENRKGLKDLNTLLQFVKTYTDYLSINVDIWEPIRNEEQYFIDPWVELQNLFENIEQFLTSNKAAFQKEYQHKLCNVILEENEFLYGFTPLSKLQPKYYNLNEASFNEIEQFLARIAMIEKFQIFYLEHAESLQCENDAEDSSFVLEELDGDMKTALDTLHKVAARDDTEIDEINKSGITKNKSLNDLKMLQMPASNVVVSAVSDDQVAQLTKLKKELEQQTNANRVYNAKLEEILNMVDTKVYIEVRPKYLMPDTNCFIDCLENFEKLLKNYQRYTLVIPLTVVRELDGLSKGIKLETRSHSMQKHRIHHFDDVSTMAKRSLDFIKNTKQNIKCVTSKGSFINASLFALAEEEYMSNDDRILATAVALSKTMCRETSKDDKCFIQTQLVLITTDRNLRVKALSRNLAVSELDEFLLWARDCNEA